MLLGINPCLAKDGRMVTQAILKRNLPLIRLLGEIALVSAGYVAYANGPLSAFDNARDIVALERSAGFSIEPVVQQWALANASTVVRISNVFYILGYSPVIVGAAIFLYVRNREAYRQTRTVDFITLGISLVVYELYPLAPPRLLFAFGVVDTIQLLGPEDYYTVVSGLQYNPYAAMPSLHFALPLVVSLHFLRSGGAVCKLTFIGYLGLVLVTVVVTGNHYVVDMAGSIAVVAAALLLLKVSKTLIGNASATHTPSTELS